MSFKKRTPPSPSESHFLSSIAGSPFYFYMQCAMTHMGNAHKVSSKQQFQLICKSTFNLVRYRKFNVIKPGSQGLIVDLVRDVLGNVWSIINQSSNKSIKIRAG